MEIGPLKIYSVRDSARLRYIADLLLNEILGLRWELVTDRRKIGKSPFINYSDNNVAGGFRINPVPLLFENDIHSQVTDVSEWHSLPVFFRDGRETDFPFDIFAASFYMVSRYEEYLRYTPDEHGRFVSSNSLASRNGFLSIPVVDLWTKELARTIVRKFPVLTFRSSIYSSITTIDADEPFEYLGKNLFGNIGGLIHDFSSGSKNAGHRIGCLRGSEADKYGGAFDYIFEECVRSKSETRFFFPVGNQSEYDLNPSWKNHDYRSLISKAMGNFDVCLHPSYKAGHDMDSLNIEIERFQTITGRKCKSGRFHYLRTKMPLSFRNLIDSGIEEDYSMGYSDAPGFRAGISRPFSFYDLHAESITSLRIFPFQVMDVMMKDNLKLSPDQAKEVILKMMEQTIKAGGLFVSIWHNTTLTDTPEGREWRKLFELTLAT